ALAWLPGPVPRAGTGTAATLRVAATASLPARILALPGVRRSPDTDAAVLTRTSAGGSTNRVLLGGQPAADDLVVRLDDGTLPDPSGDSVRFVPDRLSLTGALIAVSSLPPEEGPARVDHHQEPTAQPGDLTAVLGRATPDSAFGGALKVSLVHDGPHALVAGTTGSGKSVLLSTWLSSLTEHTGPDRLRLVLLDFKGGATFGPWTGKPHVEAIVTDLDLESATRVVEGISAEVHRRERLLQCAGVADVRDLPVAERPPRIVVAVDEFRILAESVPGVLKDLMHCATVGRSLGLHLILATQRPQGVVSPEIRANVALTICLRLTSESEAVDLTGTPLPARFPTTEPGRALIRRGSARPEPFQVDTHIGRDADDARHDLLIGPTCADVAHLPVPATSARATQQPAAALPFIAPPLPQRPVRVSAPPAPNRHGDGPPSMVLGLKATPERVIPWTHTPATDGSLAVLAAPGSHRIEQVRSWLGALQRLGTADSCVVMDGDGLAENSALAHFPGLVLTTGQEQDVDEVLTALGQGRAPHPGIRPLLVLTAPSAWFGDGLQPAGVAREAAVMTLLANRICPVIMVGGRDLSTSRLLGHAPWRVYQPWSMTPETTATWPRRHSCSDIPGRGVLLGPDTDPTGVVVQSTLVPNDRLRTKRSRHHSGATGPTIGAWSPLPDRLSADAWRRRRPTTHAEPDPPFAVRAPGLRPVGWLPTSKAAVVLGGPGSGRSTVVKELAARWPHACLLARADLEELAGGQPQAPPPPERADDEGRQLEAWWCVDDLDSLGPSALAVLSQRVRNGGRVLVAASSAASLSSQVPWWHQVDQVGGVLVLGPRGAEAAALGWRIPADPTAPPGRAWLVPAGESSPVRVQVLQPTEVTGVGW
ncbi:MAG: FtsK/SpoIIIE domain-containing protein, partial [Galactobacter sp.]